MLSDYSSVTPTRGAPVGDYLTVFCALRSLFRGLLPRSVRNVLHKAKNKDPDARLQEIQRQFDQSTEDALASTCLSIIVPVHDAPAVTRRCLASLEKYAPKAEIIIVDDGSILVGDRKDQFDEFISRNRWKLIRHETPFGHSAACEAGATLSTRPYLCLLNSDTVVTPWCWRLIKQAFEHDNMIAVVGPSTSHSGNLTDFARRDIPPATLER